MTDFGEELGLPRPPNPVGDVVDAFIDRVILDAGLNEAKLHRH